MNRAIRSLPEPLSPVRRTGESTCATRSASVMAFRIDGLLAKADKLDKEQLKHALRLILEEEGVYVRLKPRKIGPGKPVPDEDAPATPAPKATEPPPRL